MAGLRIAAPALRDGAAELVAGLLRAQFVPADSLTPEQARSALSEVLDATVRPSPLFLVDEDLDRYRLQLERRPAPWREADEGEAPYGEDVLSAGWAQVTQRLEQTTGGRGPAALRLTVRSIADALAAQNLGARLGLVVAPFIDDTLGGGQWRWPLRVGVVNSGSIGDAVAEIEHSHHQELRERPRPILLEGDAGSVDVLVTDREPPDDLRVDAGVVIVLGDPAGAGDPEALNQLLGIGVHYRAAAVIAVPGRSMQWFTGWLAELGHDWPLDVATAMAIPGAVVLGDAEFLNATPPRAWAMSVVRRLVAPEEQNLALQLTDLVSSRPFQFESQGSTDISTAVRDAEARGVASVELRFRGPQAAMAGPPDEMAEERDVAVENGGAAPAVRRLQTLVRDKQGNPRPDGFVRGTTMKLRVRIAAAVEMGAIVGNAPFVPPVPGQPVDLQVVVRVGGASEKTFRRKLHLPVFGDSAWTHPIPLAVPNHSGRLDVFVLVQYKGRTVQSAQLSGKLLAQSAKIGAPAMALSIDVSTVIDQARGSDERSATKASLVELPPVKGKPQVFDAAGKALFDPFALARANANVQKELRSALGKRHADLPAASVALTRLAIHGSLLRNVLRGKGKGFYDDAPWIHITTFDSMHVPYELIYTHPQPSSRDGVPICQPALDGAKQCGADCVDRKRADRVCPYAFWATSKVVERRRHIGDRSVTTAAEQRVVEMRSNAVVAVTSKADGKDPTASKRIHDAVGNFAKSAVVARAWPEVEQAAATNPSLLVWVTHTILPEDPEDTLGIDLELSGTLLPVIDVGPQLVHPGDSEPGPVVLALGCSTEHLAASFSSYETQLFGAAAEVVVTAICEIPGRGVADFVERLILALGEVLDDGPGPHRFGQAMTDARRTTISTGDLFALALTSAGDGDVQLKG